AKYDRMPPAGERGDVARARPEPRTVGCARPAPAPAGRGRPGGPVGPLCRHAEGPGAPPRDRATAPPPGSILTHPSIGPNLRICPSWAFAPHLCAPATLAQPVERSFRKAEVQGSSP